MGVRGLSSFFDHNPMLSKDYKLHDCSVIIDGNNLVHFLYFTNKLDCVFGGDYHRFSEVIRKHLLLYLECNIKPIIIFDGGYDTSDRKLATVLERTKERLTNAQHITKYGCCSGKVLPILAVEVMKNVLENMNVTFVQCDYEADEQITVLANHYQCPVISQDSDFYIFDISHGFIRLDFVGNTVYQEVDESGHTFKFLKCQLYLIEHFISMFPGMNKNLLPLFSTLIGNDFVHIRTFDNFFSNIKLPKFKGKLKVSPRHQKMIGLLSWLQDRSLEDAIGQVLNHVKLKKREQIRTVINNAMGSYDSPSYVILEDLHMHQDSLQSDLRTFHGKPFPSWFVYEFRCGNISPFLLNAIGLHRTFLPSQVEDMSLESSFMCSLYIRQVIYTILLAHDLRGVDFDDTSVAAYIEEYDRRSGSFRKKPVLPLTHLDGIGTVPTLEKLGELDVDYTKNFIVKVLGDDLEYFTGVPENYQLLFGCLRFWLRNCKPVPIIEILYAFIVTFIFYGITKTLEETQSNINRNSLGDGGLMKTIKNLKVTDTVTFQNNMKKYLNKAQWNNANPIKFRNIHFFCQLQACALFFTYLNKLVRSPFPNMNFQECFNGSVFYNLAKDLLTRPFSELFISELLGRDSALDILFKELKNKMLENVSRDFSTKQDSEKNISKSKKKRKVNSIKRRGTVGKEANEDIGSVPVDTMFKGLDLNEESEVDVYL